MPNKNIYLLVSVYFIQGAPFHWERGEASGNSRGFVLSQLFGMGSDVELFLQENGELRF